MLELVGRVGRDAADIEQISVGQIAERALEMLIGDRMDRVKSFIGKLAAEARRRFGRPPWPGRVDPAAPSVSHATSPGPRAR
jgi:hypothetical protein